MIVSFRGQSTEDIFNGVNSKLARKACPRTLWRVAVRKLDQLDSVLFLEELKIPPGNRLERLSAGNRLERLSGDKEGEYSIRINEQYRICFMWSETGPYNVEITDYH